MAKSGDSDSANRAKKYGDQPLSERVQDGLRVDRRADNRFRYFTRELSKLMEAGKRSLPLSDPHMDYTLSRNWSWQTRRQANRRLEDNKQVRSQMNRLWEIVMLDLLGDGQPSVKRWKKQSGHDDRLTRRTRGYYPHMIGDMSIVEKVVGGKDGTRTIPVSAVREQPKDERIKPLSTAYSSRNAFPGSFDLRVFADAAYIRRQKRFWKDALEALSKWRDGNEVHPDSEWLIYHIVNNDIAMHVLFDNLSTECESRWFKGLRGRTKYEVAGRIKTEWETLPYDKDEWKPYFDELKDYFRAIANDPETPKVVRVDGRELPADGIEAARSMVDVADLVSDVILPEQARTRGGVPSPRLVIEHEQYPYTEKDVMEALDELAEFVAGFKEEVPDGFDQYVIGQDKMAPRIEDLLHTMIAYWKDHSPDEAEMVTKALARHRHNSKRAAGGKAGE